MKNMAEKIARLFEDDGSMFYNANGDSLEHACMDAGAEMIFAARTGEITDDGRMIYEEGYRNDHVSGDPIRFLFADGSAIVVAGDGWDIEGDKPFSWEGIL